MRVIVGVGIDVVQISRIETQIAERVLTEREMVEFEKRGRKPEYLAGRFALKEAFFKALGTGLSGNSFKDVEFLTDPRGKPFLNVLKDFELVFNHAHVSLSHDLLAVAVVVLERRKGGIIVEGEPRVFEVIRGLGYGIFEIDSPYGPYRTLDVLEGVGASLLEYGNVWRRGYGSGQNRSAHRQGDR